jgi:hypothetical protein
MRPVELFLLGISHTAAFVIYSPMHGPRLFSSLQVTANAAVPRTGTALPVKSAPALMPRTLIRQGPMSSEEVASLLEAILLRLAAVEQDLKTVKKKAEV